MIRYLIAAITALAFLGGATDLCGPAAAQEKRVLKHTREYTFDGFKLGDDYANKVMSRAPYDKPCDNDPIDNNARRFMVYGAQPCRDLTFPNDTTVMFYLKYSAEDRYAQPIETFAYLHGSYFNDKSDFFIKPGVDVNPVTQNQSRTSS